MSHVPADRPPIIRPAVSDGAYAREWNSSGTDARFPGGSQRAQHACRSIVRPLLIEPTPGDDERSEAERAFMRAMQDYQRISGRRFPTWDEVLEVLRDLGPQKIDGPTALPF